MLIEGLRSLRRTAVQCIEGNKVKSCSVRKRQGWHGNKRCPPGNYGLALNKVFYPRNISLQDIYSKVLWWRLKKSSELGQLDQLRLSSGWANTESTAR